MWMYVSVARERGGQGGKAAMMEGPALISGKV